MGADLGKDPTGVFTSELDSVVRKDHIVVARPIETMPNRRDPGGLETGLRNARARPLDRSRGAIERVNLETNGCEESDIATLATSKVQQLPCVGISSIRKKWRRRRASVLGSSPKNQPGSWPRYDSSQKRAPSGTRSPCAGSFFMVAPRTKPAGLVSASRQDAATPSTRAGWRTAPVHPDRLGNVSGRRICQILTWVMDRGPAEQLKR